MTMLSKSNTIKSFLRIILEKSGKDCYVLGLSGGIDSALTLALAVGAVGKDKAKVFMLPYFENLNTASVAQNIADYYGVRSSLIDIEHIVDQYYVADYYRLGNIMARTRMTILYDMAMSLNGLVLNTCNLSEDIVGYATKFGDAAGDIAPIAHLTKTEVYKLAEFLEIPEEFINRIPSAELWESQSDEKELGFTYNELDSVIDLYREKIIPYSNYYTLNAMYKWMDNFKGAKPVNDDTWNNIRNKNFNSQHKLLPIPSLNTI